MYVKCKFTFTRWKFTLVLKLQILSKLQNRRKRREMDYRISPTNSIKNKCLKKSLNVFDVFILGLQAFFKPSLIINKKLSEQEEGTQFYWLDNVVKCKKEENKRDKEGFYIYFFQLNLHSTRACGLFKYRIQLFYCWL